MSDSPSLPPSSPPPPPPPPPPLPGPAGSLLQRAKHVFIAVREAPSPRREEELERLCAGDAPLREMVRGLLAGDAAALPFESLAENIVAAREAMGTQGAGGGMPGAVGAEVGSRIGPYRLIEKIGEGGFGVVYLAEQEAPVRRRVALKILKLGMDTRQVVARFEAERQALAILQHPGIASVHDAGATPTGRPYFVMEHCPGESITVFCDRRRVPLRQRLSLFAQVCHAVQHAHQKGLIHRDLKPGNILVSEVDGRPLAKIIDFGIAKATQPLEVERSYFTEHHQLLGTPEYMSPEQAEGSLDIDTRTDVYSLGVLLYELLTGSSPFSSKELRSAAYAEIQRIIREVEPPRPSTRLTRDAETLASVAANRSIDPRRLGVLVRGELDWIVMKSLEKDRRRRYDSAVEFARDVERFLSDEPVLARPPSAAYRWGKFARRNKLLVGAAAAVVLSLAAGLATSTALYLQADAARDAADKAREQAQRENAKFRGVNDFLTKDLLAAPNPWENAGRNVTVASVLDTSASRVGKRFAGQPEVEAAVLHTLGESYRALGLFREAQRQYDRSLELRRASPLTTERELADSLRAQAGNLQAAGRLKEADAACRDALERFTRLLGSESYDVANTLATLADIQLAQSEYAAGEKTLRESLRLLELAPPATRDEVAIARVTNTIGSALYYQGKYIESEKEKLKALDQFKAVLGERSAYVAQVNTDLGTVYSDMERYDDSKASYERALPLMAEQLGADHPTVILCRRSLANTLSFLGDHEKAASMLRETIAAGERTVGANHPDTLASVNSLATLFLRTRRDAEALPLLRDIHERARASLGEQHAETLKYALNLGWAEYKAGNATPADTAFRAALDGFVATLGPTHPSSLSALDGYAQFLGGVKRHAESARADSLLIERRAQAGLPEDLDTARFYNRVGTNFIMAKDYGAAKPALTRSLELCRTLMSADDWRTGVAEGRMGECLSFLGEFADAEAALKRSLTIAQANGDKPKGAIDAATERLVKHYERAGQPEKAAELAKPTP